MSVARTLGALAAEHRPRPQEPLRVTGLRPAAPLQVGAPFTVVSWNLQFCGSRQQHFFYDGGPAVAVPPDLEAATRRGIGDVLAAVDPALALLQEIDRGADRTGGVDQLPSLAQSAGAAAVVSAPYHRCSYVPKPASAPLGRAELHLALLSRAPLQRAVRTQLAAKRSPRLVQVYDLKRCLLTATVSLADGRALHVATTHLSAFSHGDGTLARQIDAVEAWMSSRPPECPWVLGGDFNLLPPGDDPGRLPNGPALYADAANPLARLVPRFREVAGTGRLLAPSARTYLPFGAPEPDRKIDYVFVGGPLEVVDHHVLPVDWSDHRPLVTTLRVR